MYYHIRYYSNGMYVNLERYNFDLKDKLVIPFAIRDMYRNDEMAIKQALRSQLIKAYVSEEPIRETMDKIAEEINQERGSSSYDSFALTYLFDSSNDYVKEVTGEIKLLFGV